MKFKTRGAAKTLSLSVDASTWPPKGRVRGAEAGGATGRSPEDGVVRPSTATLDKPLVLDIALLGQLDMTTLTRRGLVCHFRRANKGVVGVLAPASTSTPTPRAPRQSSRTSSRSDVSGDEAATPVSRRRGVAGSSNALVRQKKTVIEEDDEESSWTEDDRYSTYRVRRNNRLNRTFRVPATPVLLGGAKAKRQPLNNIILNNNNSDSMDAARPGPRARRGPGPGLDDILGAREQVPEPCRTCGRPELPERLHSHPKQPGRPRGAPNQHFGMLHPAQAMALATPQPAPPLLPKNTVKKPVPIKYRPRRGSEGTATQRAPPALRTLSPSNKAASPARKAASPARNSPAKGAFLVTHFVDPDTARAPRVVSCFVCGREFGTASLPLHEPQCIQRWTLQNSRLPPQWQRSLPEKPVGPITIDDWNKFAWDSSKRADSVQCPNCLRRFCPDRVNSHERVCFKKLNAIDGEPQTKAMHGAHGSPLVECYLCGKKFGTRSIGIHEPQCLKKLQQADQAHDDPAGALGRANVKANALPSSTQTRGLKTTAPADCLPAPALGAPAKPKPLAIELPSSKAPAPAPAPAPDTAPAPARSGSKDRPRTETPPQPKSAWAGEDGVALGPAVGPTPVQTAGPAPGPATNPQGKLVPNTRGRPLQCYLCGRLFGVKSLCIHEPQCLNKWRLENAKLPPHQQRPEPEKPEIIFTETGQVDMDATAEAAWQAHLSQLVACSHCGRKFSPDRIGIHERCCKG